MVADPGLNSTNFEKLSGCADWDEQLKYWRNKLSAVAEQFLSGQTEVDPLEGAATCKNCGLQTFCRVQEMDTFLFDGEDK